MKEITEKGKVIIMKKGIIISVIIGVIVVAAVILIGFTAIKAVNGLGNFSDSISTIF